MDGSVMWFVPEYLDMQIWEGWSGPRWWAWWSLVAAWQTQQSLWYTWWTARWTYPTGPSPAALCGPSLSSRRGSQRVCLCGCKDTSWRLVEQSCQPIEAYRGVFSQLAQRGKRLLVSFADFINQFLQFSTQLVIFWKHHLLLHILLLFVSVVTHSYTQAQTHAEKHNFLAATSSWQIKEKTLLTFFGHANLKALLEAAVLAAVSSHFVDLTVFVTVAGVNHILLNTAAKETLEGTEKKIS